MTETKVAHSPPARNIAAITKPSGGGSFMPTAKPGTTSIAMSCERGFWPVINTLTYASADRAKTATTGHCPTTHPRA